MIEWPKRYGVVIENIEGQNYFRYAEQNNAGLVTYEDFERLLEFAAKAMIAGKLIENHDIKGVEKIILETIRGNND